MMRAAALLLAAFVLAMPELCRSAEPVLFVEDPALLSKLEAGGYGFAALFGGGEDDGLEGLAERSAAYRSVVDTIAADVAELREQMRAGGRPLKEFTAAETGRVIDMRWLRAPEARLRLVGVVNRVDRRDFQAAGGERACGEVRLIYRLAYSFHRGSKGQVLSSRMPFSLNAVFDLEPDADGGCVGVASRWAPQIDESVDAGWLAGGPLDRSAMRFRQLELNAQVVRFPSGQEPEFGGQAVYLMRIFGIDGDSVSELPMENTPDGAKLESDAELKAKLAEYIAGNVGAIDSGVYRVPDEFLAAKVVSFSTFGNARDINHPFSSLFAAQDLKGMDFAPARLVRTPEALLARLDNGTCQGCHQAGATAGFHFLGLDDKFTSPLNRIEIGISPHFHAEIPRRSAWLRAVAEEREPNRFRPLSFAPPAAWSDEGRVIYESADATMSCIAEKDQAHLAGDWACGAGTVCTPLAERKGAIAVAQCLLPPESDAMFSGHPCLAGTVEASQHMPFNDRYELTQFTAFAKKASASDYTCRPPRIGVPGGLAYRKCDASDRGFARFEAGQALPREVCGLTGGKAFDICVSTGKFDQCLAGAVQRGNRASCSAEHFCRDDYICQAFPADTPNVRKIKGVGFCSPTYFLFQMRIDNHTTPWNPRAKSEYRSVEAPPEDGDPDGLW